MTETERREEIERLRKWGSVTRSGVVFHDELVNIDGSGFILYEEEHTTEEDLRRAEAQIRSERDVVRLSIDRLKKGKDSGK